MPGRSDEHSPILAPHTTTSTDMNRPRPAGSVASGLSMQEVNSSSANGLADLNQDEGDVSKYDDGDERAPLTADPEAEAADGEAVVDQTHVPAPIWYAVFTTIPVFMGYSGMAVLQGGLKTRLNIASGSHDAYIFGVACGNLYLGNLIFRLFHNIIFTFLRPRQRVMFSYLSIITSFTILLVPYYFFTMTHLVFVFIAYLVAGMGIGTFESNLISCLTPLGHGTKSWAVIGIPIGFNSVSIGSFIFQAIFPSSDLVQAVFYGVIVGANVFGLLFYVLAIPNVPFAASKDTVATFIKDLGLWREWLPTIWKHCAALSADMLCVSLFASVVLYIYDVDPLPIWPNSAAPTIPKNVFLGIYFTCSFLGDFTSRKIVYHFAREVNPFWYLILSAAGVGTVLSKTAIVAPLGMFMIMFANGSIYATTTKYVDNHVPKKYNLMALSVWLFIGDLGSYIGSQVTQPLRDAIGAVPKHQGASAPLPPPPSNTTTTTTTTAAPPVE